MEYFRGVCPEAGAAEMISWVLFEYSAVTAAAAVLGMNVRVVLGNSQKMNSAPG